MKGTRQRRGHLLRFLELPCVGPPLKGVESLIHWWTIWRAWSWLEKITSPSYKRSNAKWSRPIEKEKKNV
jgi:hypothetical protein